MVAAGACAFGLSVALAQSPPAAAEQAEFANPPHKNLKIYPATLPREQLLANMRLFSQSIGVRCSHCHVGEEGQPLSTFDFASDAKAAKLTARRMLLMVRRINREDFGVQQFSDVKVTCYTCHRGSTKPAIFPPQPPVPGSAAPPPTAPAAERG